MKPRPCPRYRAAFVPAVFAAAAVLVFVCAVPGPASGGSPGGSPTSSSPERSGFYSNLGLLETISREAANAIADSLTLPPGTAVTLYSSTPHDANWFVGTVFGEILAKRGYKVRILDWEPAPAHADSSSQSSPSSPTLAHPNRPHPGGEQNPQGQGAPLAESDEGGDGTGDGTTPADTTVANPDSVRAAADSIRGGAEGEPSDKTSPGEKRRHGGQPAASQPQPTGSTGTPASGQAPAAALRVLPPGEVLDLRVVEFGVSYADVGRKLLFGPVRFTRVAGVYLQVSSRKEPEGELRQVLSAERHSVDRLTGSQRALAEGASYPFRIPELHAPGLGRYIEPTVVVGIVSSLVYLFYANQSNK